MNRNLFGIVAYPVVLWVSLWSASFLAAILKREYVTSPGSILLLLSPLIIAGLASGWIARSKPVLVAILGSLVHSILLVAFAPLVLDLLTMPTSGPPAQIESMLSEATSPRATLAIRVLAVVFFPLVAVIAGAGGFLGARLRRKPSP